jgi:mitogen-activated protein kinase 1/3
MAAHTPWCSGADAVPLAPAAPAPAAPPAGLEARDDGSDFTVPANLIFEKMLGKGPYGSVGLFQDTQRGVGAAIKRIPNPFRNPIDGKRCLREVKLLQLLKHENILGLVDILSPPAPNFNEVYIVTEPMDADLHTVIYSESALSDDHVQFFVYQILCALLYMHSANVVHRDLKPLNVLVNKNCDVKLCDFGLARGRAGFSQEDDDFLRTEYVGTRWYRAPEVVLTSMEYTAAVDIWSAGCILGECIGRKPMFTGRDFLDQIGSIVKVLGTPSEQELSFIPQENRAARDFIKARFPSFPKKSWVEVYPLASDDQRDILDQMLRFDFHSRPSAQHALRHKYLADYHCEEDEIVAPCHIDWSFDDVEGKNSEKLRCLTYLEAAKLHPDILVRDQDELARLGWVSTEVPPPR